MNEVYLISDRLLPLEGWGNGDGRETVLGSHRAGYNGFWCTPIYTKVCGDIEKDLGITISSLAILRRHFLASRVYLKCPLPWWVCQAPELVSW